MSKIYAEVEGLKATRGERIPYIEGMAKSFIEAKVLVITT